MTEKATAIVGAINSFIKMQAPQATEVVFVYAQDAQGRSVRLRSVYSEGEHYPYERTQFNPVGVANMEAFLSGEMDELLRYPESLIFPTSDKAGKFIVSLSRS